MIRLATPADIPRLVQCTREAFEETRALGLPSSALKESAVHWSALRPDSDHVHGAALIFEDDGRLIASVRLRFDVPIPLERLHAAADGLPSARPALQTLSFERLQVAPTHRRLGHASAMVRSVIELAECLGAEEVRADARSERPDSRSFYTRLGFKIVGATDCYGIPGLRTQLRLSLAHPPDERTATGGDASTGGSGGGSTASSS